MKNTWVEYSIDIPFILDDFYLIDLIEFEIDGLSYSFIDASNFTYLNIFKQFM